MVYTDAMLLVKRLLLVLALLVLATVLVLVIASRTVPGLEISNLRGALHTVTGLGATKAEPSKARTLSVAAGYRFNIFSSDVPGARMMTLTDSGDLIVSASREGKIYRLTDRNGDGVAEETVVLASGLKNPHGLAIQDDWLYIAESHQVSRTKLEPASYGLTDAREVIIPGLPDDGGHNTRTIHFGPEGKLYLTIGSSCNVCEEIDPRRATMMQFNADGSDSRIFASGLRNSVDFDWAPWSGELFATDNGRDLLGDNFPPEELNRVVDGGFYGWPYINGFGKPDPDFGSRDHPQNSLPPVFGFPAHNAPLGIRFLQHQPADNKVALVALHGSWNRSTPDGYKVVRVSWMDDGSIVAEDFISGFLRPDSSVIGRPVSIIENKQGVIYISDDFAGAIYRVAPTPGHDNKYSAPDSATAGKVRGEKAGDT